MKTQLISLLVVLFVQASFSQGNEGRLVGIGILTSNGKGLTWGKPEKEKEFSLPSLSEVKFPSVFSPTNHNSITAEVRSVSTTNSLPTSSPSKSVGTNPPTRFVL